MPSFAGQLIFGYQVVCVTSGTTRDAQTNAYFGISGMEELDGGFRGHMTMVSGRLVGFKAAGGLGDLIAALAAFRNLFDGNAYTLVDSFGAAWNNVKMESFDPQPPVIQTPDQWFVTYTALFKHLSEY